MKAKPPKKPATDRATRAMIRGPADEQAVAQGCRFDEDRASHAVEWIEKTCVLYEGDFAGQPMRLEDWQLDATRRLFGWVRWSEKWTRWVRRFKRAIVFIAKKNGKSPTLAAWGLYLLLADAEQGQKVYSVAKNGKQAMIAHRHAIEMLKRCPTLYRPDGRGACTVNNLTGQITYHATSSTYSVVAGAGDNKDAQEGLNGSCMVDEVHVVDGRLGSILRYAGASRSEALTIEVSTAGNNPDSYGKQRFDYAVEVQKNGGDVQTLAIVYAAPQDLSHADLDADPVKYGKMANPAWGRLIDGEEYLAEYREARKSLPALLDFLMYRCNIWQQAASPWLRAGDWAACVREYTEADLEGRACYAGLDLSKTRDMSSLVLCFPEGDETFKLLAYFWLPEERVKEIQHLIPKLADWIRDGWIQVTPGNTIDYGFIKARFRKLAKRFDIREMAYDRTYADDLTQSLEQGQTDDEGNVIEEGTGVERFVFRQQPMEFAEPTADFERAVLAGKMHHDGNPLLAWQAGHVQVKTDANNNKRPVKPSPNDPKTIDGIVAAIMASARASKADAGPSVEELLRVEVW